MPALQEDEVGIGRSGEQVIARDRFHSFVRARRMGRANIKAVIWSQGRRSIWAAQFLFCYVTHASLC